MITKQGLDLMVYIKCDRQEDFLKTIKKGYKDQSRLRGSRCASRRFTKFIFRIFLCKIIVTLNRRTCRHLIFS